MIFLFQSHNTDISTSLLGRLFIQCIDMFISFCFILIFRVTPLHHQTISPVFGMRDSIWNTSLFFFLINSNEKVALFAQSNVVFCIEINAVVNAWPWQTKPYRRHHYEIHPKISKRNAHISPNASIFIYISKARMKKDKNKTLSKFMCSIQTQFDYSTICRTTKKITFKNMRLVRALRTR